MPTPHNWLRNGSLLVPDLSEDDYHANHAVSKSVLDRINQSPLHCKAYIEGLRKRTKAKDFGSAAHSAILEPEKYLKEYAVFSGDRRTKDGKATYESIIQSGRNVISADDNDAISRMQFRINEHPSASKLLQGGIVESSVFWQDAETGLDCKCRPDYMRNDGVIVDLKTTDNASPEAFTRSIVTYRYHVQAAHYMAGTGAERFIFIAVEKTAPYAVGVYEIDAVSLELGALIRRDNLALYAECLNSGHWPGYSQEIDTLSLPSWAFPKTTEEEIEVSYV